MDVCTYNLLSGYVNENNLPIFDYHLHMSIFYRWFSFQKLQFHAVQIFFLQVKVDQVPKQIKPLNITRFSIS